MIDDNDEERPFCPSCHKAYIDHDGLIRTCRDLQLALDEIKRLRQSLRLILTSQSIEDSKWIARAEIERHIDGTESEELAKRKGEVVE